VRAGAHLGPCEKIRQEAVIEMSMSSKMNAVYDEMAAVQHDLYELASASRGESRMRLVTARELVVDAMKLLRSKPARKTSAARRSPKKRTSRKPR
jgi:hypothetical protein